MPNFAKICQKKKIFPYIDLILIVQFKKNAKT